MGKTELCIKMLNILSTGRLYKVSELADLLETNPRNIIEYKKELEECGYYIINVPGRYGGYKLEEDCVMPSIKLSEIEKEALIESFNFSLSKKDFIKKDDFIRAMGKIMASIRFPENKDDLLVVDKYQLTMSDSDIETRYRFIEEMIEKKHVIEILYRSVKSGLKTHQLHPYKLFIYNNTWFFLAWDPAYGEVRYYKLNRMIEYKETQETFRVWKYFKPEDYFDETGLKNNGAYIHLEYLVTGIHRQLVKERVYGKNQEVIDIDDTTSKVKVDMQNESQIVSYVLSCGREIKVLEPSWVIDKIQDVIKYYQETYTD